tara:strand:+ start:1425 stop:2099 length:675 start_codon:yes stop_codon:yes gene_type:complete
MNSPSTIIFDVNETLLDLAPLKESVGRALGGRQELSTLWFTTMTHYSVVETMTGTFRPFSEIGVGVLQMMANSHGIEMTRVAAERAIEEPLSELTTHPDVLPAMKALRNDGYRLITLTNSPASGSEEQLEKTGISAYLDRRYSVETVQKFKPHPSTYEYVLKDQNVDASETVMVAAHAWDLAGAHQVGLQTGFVARKGCSLYPNAPHPDFVMTSLVELAPLLRK